MIDEVQKNGKNWGKVLDSLHNNAHLLTDVDQKDTLRKRFQKCVDEWYLNNAEYEISQFVRPLEITNEEEIRKLEEDHLIQEEKNKKKQNDLKNVLFSIEKQEISKNTNNTYTEVELRAEISLDKFESKLFFRFFKTFANNENYTIDVQKLGEHFGFDLQSMGIQQKTQPP